jgi:hypothetical protein
MSGFFFVPALRVIWQRETNSWRSNFYLVRFCRTQDVFAAKLCRPVAILMSRDRPWKSNCTYTLCAKGYPIPLSTKKHGCVVA